MIAPIFSGQVSATFEFTGLENGDQQDLECPKDRSQTHGRTLLSHCSALRACNYVQSTELGAKGRLSYCLVVGSLPKCKMQGGLSLQEDVRNSPHPRPTHTYACKCRYLNICSFLHPTHALNCLSHAITFIYSTFSQIKYIFKLQLKCSPAGGCISVL